MAKNQPENTENVDCIIVMHATDMFVGRVGKKPMICVSNVPKNYSFIRDRAPILMDEYIEER